MFRASVLLGYIPRVWQRSKVIFIPKPGKKTYDQPRSFRPISLSSFVLKTLERLWLWHLNDTDFKENPMSEEQHAFRTGFSTESALSNATEYIEKGMLKHGFALSVFLDIQGAFDNVPINGLLEEMSDRHLNPLFIQWYGNLLKTRNISVTLRGASLQRTLTQGTAQGGVISPNAWNTFMESLIRLFRTGMVRITVFADDAKLVTFGGNPGQLAVRMQEAVNKVLDWGDEKGLTFSPSKTVVVLFTRRNKFQTPPKIRMGDTEIPYSNGARYLGIWLDSKLSWHKHVTNKINDAKRLLLTTKGAIGKLWGPDPKCTKWLFTGIIRPALTYGSLVWAKACRSQNIRQKLTKLHRLFLLTLGHFRRSTPTAGLEAITGHPPLDLWIEMEAAMGYLRTIKHVKVDVQDLITTTRSYIGHRQHCRQLLQDLDLDYDSVDLLPATKDWNSKFRVVKKSLGEGLPPKETRGCVDYYTDGSRMNGLTGAGLAVYDDGELQAARFVHLGEEITVYQAEVYAIKMAAKTMQTTQCGLKHLRIYTDSQSAVLALASSTVNSKMILNCRKELNNAAKQNRLTVHWIKAHVGHPGNEKADELAKEGAETPWMTPPDSIPMSKAVMRGHVKDKIQEQWNNRWQALQSCRQTKQWLPELDPGLSKQIMRMNRKELSIAVQVITGHNFLRRHSALVARDPDEELKDCRLCLEDEETTHHIVAECPALALTRRQIFGSDYLTVPLKWSPQLTMFLRGRPIGVMLDYDSEADTATMAVAEEDGEE